MDRNKVMITAIYLIGFLAVWNLCDVIFDLLIHRGSWTVSLFDNLGQPLLIAIFVRLVLNMIPKKK